jgi:thiol:disulfide interchange protein DsbD
MIPITISYIGGRSRTKLGGLFLSVFFVLGIALTYSSLGIIAASTGALFGSAMQSTAVIVGVSLIFVAMGASMLGAFDLALPSGLQTRLQSGPRGGVLGALFMGMVTGLVASPCVGPVVVVLLTWVAQMGSVFFGFLLLFVFALGLGLLFLILGTFAGALQALPAAGQWMDSVKHIFGVILLGMAIYYLRPLLGPNVTWIVTGAFVVVVGTFLGAFTPVGEEPGKKLLLQKGLGIVLLVVGSFALLVGLARLTGLPMNASPSSGNTAAVPAAHEGLAWVHDDEQGRSAAVSAGKPALIDFYADWCGACKELDEKTWSDAQVRREGERFVAIKLDLTKRNDWSAGKQSSYGVPGLPTVILFDSSGREATRFFGFKPAGDVLALMQAIR